MARGGSHLTTYMGGTNSFNAIFLNGRAGDIRHLFAGVILRTFHITANSFQASTRRRRRVFSCLVSLTTFLHRLLSFYHWGRTAPKSRFGRPRNYRPLGRFDRHQLQGSRADDRIRLADFPRFPSRIEGRLGMVVGGLTPVHLSSLTRPFGILFRIRWLHRFFYY